MSQNKEKIVQAFIQAVKEVSGKVTEANDLAQAFKAKWIALNPDLTDTNLSQAEVNSVNSFLNDLEVLSNNIVVSTVNGKSISSHGTKALG